ncbi:MAG: hypothetical protein V4503_08960 [Gemmatimonadota bacterium]
MLRFIDSLDDAENIRRTVQEVCRLDRRLPDMVFRGLRPVALFSSDEMLSPKFPDLLRECARYSNGFLVYLFQVDPSPEMYLEEFGFFRVAEFPVETPSQAVLDLLEWAPAAAPADDVATTGRTIVWTGEDGGWAIWVDRMLEIAVLAIKPGSNSFEPGSMAGFPFVSSHEALELIGLTFPNRVPEDFQLTFLANYGPTH